MSNLVRRGGFIPHESFFDDFLTKNLFDWTGRTSERNTVPKVNIVETHDDFRVEMAAPGMTKEDFHVELEKDMLTIYSELEKEENDERKKYTRREFSYESFRRSIHLPNTVEADKIKATYKDGLLTVLIPKKEEARTKPTRTISIS